MRGRRLPPPHLRHHRGPVSSIVAGQARGEPRSCARASSTTRSARRSADVSQAVILGPDRPAFFIWEGVTNYLTAEAVDATFRWLSGTAAGSRVLFTYVHRGILDGSARFEGAGESMDTVRRVGEPFTFGFDPAALPAYLRARGLTLVEDVGAPEYRARYLAPLGRASLKVSAFYRAAVAEV